MPNEKTPPGNSGQTDHCHQRSSVGHISTPVEATPLSALPAQLALEQGHRQLARIAGFQDSFMAVAVIFGLALLNLAYGEPVEEICRLATELKVDLIVLGHRKQTSFASRWWKGSVGISLLDRAPCSILVAVSC
ncbi:MAG: universal stress protein [Oryzomonas sp.]